MKFSLELHQESVRQALHEKGLPRTPENIAVVGYHTIASFEEQLNEELAAVIENLLLDGRLEAAA